MVDAMTTLWEFFRIGRGRRSRDRYRWNKVQTIKGSKGHAQSADAGGETVMATEN
jgi:hypothetical protein